MTIEAIGTERVNCDLCGADDYTVLFEGGDRRHSLPGSFTMVQCRQCDLVYLNARPDQETLPRYYPEDYSPYSARQGAIGRLTATLRHQEAARMKKRLPPKARILEVGCAAGDLLVPLRDQGFDVAGVEMSPYASSIAREKFGLPVHTGTLVDAPFEENSFDAVVMRSVIEHFPSPRAEAGRAAKFLTRGGQLFITTDNFASLDRRVFGENWYGFDVPRHLNLFTPQTLTTLLESAGFTVRQVRYSLVPNHWVVSSRYMLERRMGKNAALKFLSIRNPVLLPAFLPVTLAQRLLKNGGRMSVVATKEAPPPNRPADQAPRSQGEGGGTL